MWRKKQSLASEVLFSPPLKVYALTTKRTILFVSLCRSALTLQLAALFTFSLYLSLRVSLRQMYLLSRERRAQLCLNKPIRAVWNGMFKLYWCHIHDLKPKTTRLSVISWTTRKQHKCLFASLFDLDVLVNSARFSRWRHKDQCLELCVGIRKYQINRRREAENWGWNRRSLQGRERWRVAKSKTQKQKKKQGTTCSYFT